MEKIAKAIETIKIMGTIKGERKENKIMSIKRREAGEILVQWD